MAAIANEMSGVAFSGPKFTTDVCAPDSIRDPIYFDPKRVFPGKASGVAPVLDESEDFEHDNEVDAVEWASSADAD
jgi:hypothetical protein